MACCVSWAPKTRPSRLGATARAVQHTRDATTTSRISGSEGGSGRRRIMNVKEVNAHLRKRSHCAKTSYWATVRDVRELKRDDLPPLPYRRVRGLRSMRPSAFLRDGGHTVAQISRRQCRPPLWMNRAEHGPKPSPRPEGPGG